MSFTVVPNYFKIKSIENSSVSVLLLHLLTESTMVSYLSQSILSLCVGVKKNSHPTALEAAVRQDLSSEQHYISAVWFKQWRWSKTGTGSDTGQGHQWGADVAKLDKFLNCWAVLKCLDSHSSLCTATTAAFWHLLLEAACRCDHICTKAINACVDKPKYNIS